MEVLEVFEMSLPNYFQYLVNHFFKILPMKESGEETLAQYMSSLRFEIMGFNRLFTETNYNAYVVTLLSILQGLIDEPESDVSVFRREVFHAINICNKLQEMYGEAGECNGCV